MVASRGQGGFLGEVGTSLPVTALDCVPPHVHRPPLLACAPGLGPALFLFGAFEPWARGRCSDTFAE